MKVCIAEKPSVAREIAEVLGATQRIRGELETLESGVATYDPSPVRYQTNRESYV